MGEYCEMEQRWFPWQRMAQTSKCKAQYSRNVADEATQRRVKITCGSYICFGDLRRNNVMDVYSVKVPFVEQLLDFYL